MSTMDYRDGERDEQRRIEGSVKLIDQAVEWFRKEVYSRRYGRIELGIAMHDGEIKNVRRTVSDRAEESLEDEA
jgi:hypothetical protein